MSLCRLVLISVLGASFMACATENVDTHASSQGSESEVAEPLSVPDSLKLAPAGGGAETAAAACVVEDGCARHGGGTDCEWIGDVDCGGTFCHTPAEQCNGQPSTFQRVEHWYVCSRSPTNGGECYKSVVGRYLVACGC